MTWHPDEALLARYAAAAVDDADAAPVEAHLLACAACRADVAVRLPGPRLDAVWSDVVDRIDRPRVGVAERVLVALGVAPHLARLLAATPALTGSWVAAVAGVLLFGVLAAHLAEGGVSAFLALAPLIPLAGIATAYGPGVDPAYEVAAAAPMPSIRLLLLRALAVLASSCALVGVASLALPVGWAAAAWLLPALALSLGALALGSVVDPLRASVGVAAAWATGVLAVTLGPGSADVLLTPGAQLAAGGLAAIAGVAVALRRQREAA
jgi:hypothetical protein